MITSAITSKYKKANNNMEKQLKIHGKRILEKKVLVNRFEINPDSNTFKTLKDPKENFNNNAIVRLINSWTIELERISKTILDIANKNIQEAINSNQWKKTETVIGWFKGICKKHLRKLLIFNIKESCPSIT